MTIFFLFKFLFKVFLLIALFVVGFTVMIVTNEYLDKSKIKKERLISTNEDKKFSVVCPEKLEPSFVSTKSFSQIEEENEKITLETKQACKNSFYTRFLVNVEGVAREIYCKRNIDRTIIDWGGKTKDQLSYSFKDLATFGKEFEIRFENYDSEKSIRALYFQALDESKSSWLEEFVLEHSKEKAMEIFEDIVIQIKKSENASV